MSNCLCGSGHSYSTCCQPYHSGSLFPETALQLMRSRYVAYALNIPDYIINTTHPASPHYEHNLFNWKRSLLKFSQSNTFEGLEIVDFKEQGDLAVVIFIARFSQEGDDVTFSEKSYFEKIENRWFYKWGQIAEGSQPDFKIEDPLKILSFAYYGDPILTKKAEPIKEVTDEICQLVEEMVETMDASQGLGLAAPQVHRSIRLFIIRKPSVVNKKIELGELMVFINPEILALSQETWRANEGCLSIPSIRDEVERPKTITVEYTNLKGERIRDQFSDWSARVILHENDHLDGVLFIDHLEKQQSQKINPLLQNLKKRIQSCSEL